MVDERPLAGRIVGWMFVVGAIVTTLLPLLPGANGEVLTPTLPIGIAALVWGVVAVARIRWRTRPAWVIHVRPCSAGAVDRGRDVRHGRRELARALPD